MKPKIFLAAIAAALLGPVLSAGPVLAQKYGGILKAVHRENPPNLSIHDNATVSTVWPMMPVYSNLVLYNPAHAEESADDLVAELAETWTWSDNHKRLTFKLRHGVKWHDGQPFTSADVKYTFDLLRGLTPKKLRINPRKLWYENVKDVTTQGDYEVSFILEHPQPSLLSFLATGYSPIYPAHIDVDELRNRAVGTGPFRLKTYDPDKLIEVEKNPDYFIKGRPYLDGITYTIIKDRSARTAALITGQIEILFPQEAPPTVRDQVLAAVPQMVVHKVAQSTYYNIVVNTQKPPFDNLKVRQAINYALDRGAFLQTQLGGAVAGGVLMPPPYSPWGLPANELAKLPGWGDAAKDKAIARTLLTEAGYGPGKPLTLKVSTRAVPLYQDMAVWAIAELKQVGIDATLDVVESSRWFPMLTRGDYELGANMTGAGSEDPDANLFENFSCGSPRNYSRYCSQEVQAMMERESQETDGKKRLQMVREVDKRVQIEVARSMLGQALDFQMNWPHVKGYVPHHSIYSYGRMQDVWLDK